MSHVSDAERLGAESGHVAGTGAASPVSERLHVLERAGQTELRTEWRRHFGTEPPRLSRDLLVRALAYQVQVRAFGGLTRASLRRLEAADREGAHEPGEPDASATLRPGARLVREWRGRTHVVTATEAGFEYAGTHHASLTGIAKLITGTHWSGPRFFGLTRRRVSVGGADV